VRFKPRLPDYSTFEHVEDTQSDSELAEQLTQLVINLEDSATILLDGSWGAGKTTFALRWISQLKGRSVATVYLNAFAMDYLESPFVAVAGAIAEAAENGTSKDKRSRFVNAAAKVGRTLAGTAAKISVRAATLGLADLSDVEALKDVVADPLGDKAEEAVKSAIEDHKKRRTEISELRDSLSALSSDCESKRLVIVIDELDRCRPDFALGVLEVIKHFFGTDGTIFAIVSNSAQLESSVRHRYGLGTDARTYLRRFYDLRVDYVLNYKDSHGTKIGSVIGKLGSQLLPASQDRQLIVQLMRDFTRAYRLSLRDVENIFSGLAITFATSAGKNIPTLLTAFLASLKTVEPELYRKAKTAQITYAEIEHFVDSAEWKEFDSGRLKTILRWHLDPSIDITSDEFRGYASGYWHLDRLSVIASIANTVIDRFGITAT
jgi:hypothetical protein